jgi:predicted DNA-binding transcriptional regulator AlpA
MAPKALPAVPPALAEFALIDVRQVSAACGLSAHTWQRLVRAGAAPQPAVRAPRYTRWRLADVRTWLQQRAEQNDHEQAERVSARARQASAMALAARKARAAALRTDAPQGSEERASAPFLGGATPMD